jgi:excinuclease ABC subunit A
VILPRRQGYHSLASAEPNPNTERRTPLNSIVVRNARQHNLKGIDLDLPHRRLIVVTGPSGSGKSSLAFDTIYAEGQRRYVESLSTYAKQFLERMEKPDVDLVEGIAPAVAIEQKNPTKTSRSTVGTATEVQDYLRLLWARAGRTFCPECGEEVRPDTVQSATDALLDLEPGTRVVVAFPLPLSARASHERVVENLREMGFVRVLAAGDTVMLDEPGATDPTTLGHDLAKEAAVSVVVDRLVVGAEVRERLADSVGTAFAEGEGEALVMVHAAGDTPGSELRFSERFRCEKHPDIRFVEPQPRLFSFNNPFGSCTRCTGFGAVLDYDESLVVPDPDRSLRQGAIAPWEVTRYRKKYRTRLLDFARASDVSSDEPWAELPAEFRSDVLHGVRSGGRRFQGVFPFLKSRERKRYKPYIRMYLRRYQLATTCPECEGARLRPEALRVRVAGRHIGQVSALTIAEARSWLTELDAGATPVSRAVSRAVSPTVSRAVSTGEMDAAGSPRGDAAAAILREILGRLSFLDDVGLGYLSLDRQTRTLSGGEAQRIALANSLGSALVDTLYVLDEPTIGLHPRDNDRLIAILEKLRDAGNTVLVVEHDPAVILRADHLVELGPGSGEKGGQVVFQGSVEALLGTCPPTPAATPTSTALYLSGALEPPRSRLRAVDGATLALRGARLHNLEGVDVDFPLHTLTVVSGVSGSGKSTLVHDVLYRALERELSGEHSAKEYLGEAVGRYEALDGIGYVDGVALVDQSPIGRTPRSNPATYTKAFDEVRRIFAAEPLSKERGYRAGRFSFNTAGGRCEVCKGCGLVQVEMVFMADVYVPCDGCGGARYKRETLDVKVRGKSIRDVLELTVDEAIRFFIREDRLGRSLWQLQQVGLGYLRLGQAAPTLSGGEAQRMKIARELGLAGRKKGNRVYVLDEPTTGLSGPEVHRLVDVLQKLVDAGNTVVVIEHNLDVIAAADWLIELGPEAGPGGGRVVAAGRPADVAAEGTSHTGVYLRERFGAGGAVRS